MSKVGARGRSENGKDNQRTTLKKRILQEYRETEGCPPLRSHWGNYDLAQTPLLGK
jgi:hypothetical protein